MTLSVATQKQNHQVFSAKIILNHIWWKLLELFNFKVNWIRDVMALYWGWVVCVCFLILFTLSAGVAFSFTEVLVPMSEEIRASMSILDWLGSLPTALPMLLAPIATMMYYKFGTRTTVYLGIVMTSTALALTAITNHVVLMFLIYGVTGGVGITFIVNPPFFLLDEYFPYHHPRHVLATSVIACAFPAATLIFNPLTYEIIEGHGWRMVYTILSLTMLVVGSLTAATFRPRDSSDLMITTTGATSGSKQDAYDEMIQPHVTLHRRTEVIMGGIWFLASTCKAIGYYTPFLTLVKQMVVLGISQSKASNAMAIFGAFEIVSRLITSYVGDYFKGRILYAYVAFSLCLSVLNFVAAYAHNFGHMLAYGIVLGTLGGPIIAAMYSSCSEVLLGQQVPSLFTVFRVGLGIGNILGPTVAGAIYDATGSFYIVYHITGVIYIIAAIGYALIIIFNKYRPSWIYPDTLLSTHDDVMDVSMDDVMLETDLKASIFEPTHDTVKASSQGGGGVWRMSDKQKLVFHKRAQYGSNRQIAHTGDDDDAPVKQAQVRDDKDNGSDVSLAVANNDDNQESHDVKKSSSLTRPMDTDVRKEKRRRLVKAFNLE